MKKDRNGKQINEKSFLLIDGDIVCQALTCEDDTMLYEEFIIENDKIQLTDNWHSIDDFESEKIEIICFEDAKKILKGF